MYAETCLVLLNTEPLSDRRQSHWDKHYVKHVFTYVSRGKSTQLRRYQQRSELLDPTQKASIDKMQLLWTAFFRCPRGIKKQGQCPAMNIFAQQDLSGCTVVGAKKPKKENSQTAYQRYLRAIEQVTRTGFEPMMPPWKGGVLTTWPTGQNATGNLVAVTGFEPVTPWVWTKCSSQLSYTAVRLSPVTT